MGFGQQNDLRSAIFKGFRGILRWALLVKGGAYRTPIAASRSRPRRSRVDGGGRGFRIRSPYRQSPRARTLIEGSLPRRAAAFRFRSIVAVRCCDCGSSLRRINGGVRARIFRRPATASGRRWFRFGERWFAGGLSAPRPAAGGENRLLLA